jgi:hypothetical protein
MAKPLHVSLIRFSNSVLLFISQRQIQLIDNIHEIKVSHKHNCNHIKVNKAYTLILLRSIEFLINLPKPHNSFIFWVDKSIENPTYQIMLLVR